MWQCRHGDFRNGIICPSAALPTHPPPQREWLLPLDALLSEQLAAAVDTRLTQRLAERPLLGHPCARPALRAVLAALTAGEPRLPLPRTALVGPHAPPCEDTAQGWGARAASRCSVGGGLIHPLPPLVPCPISLVCPQAVDILCEPSRLADLTLDAAAWRFSPLDASQLASLAGTACLWAPYTRLVGEWAPPGAEPQGAAWSGGALPEDAPLCAVDDATLDARAPLPAAAQAALLRHGLPYCAALWRGEPVPVMGHASNSVGHSAAEVGAGDSAPRVRARTRSLPL